MENLTTSDWIMFGLATLFAGVWTFIVFVLARTHYLKSWPNKTKIEQKSGRGRLSGLAVTDIDLAKLADDIP
jgi:hypothetical protein